MKATIKFVSILLIVFIASCGKSDLTNLTLIGSWKISSLVVDGIDKTMLVSDYTITFDDNGMMSMHAGMDGYSCSWSEVPDMMDSTLMDGMGSGMMGPGMMGGYDFNMMNCCPDSVAIHELHAEWIIDNETEHTCVLHQKNSPDNILSLVRI